MKVLILTLKLSRVGAIWTQHQKHTFLNEFALKCKSLVKQSITKQRKNKKSDVQSKWGPTNHLKFHDINFPAKNGKTIFLREFFHEICLINKEYKYNYIAEINWKKITWLGFKGQNNSKWCALHPNLLLFTNQPINCFIN